MADSYELDFVRLSAVGSSFVTHNSAGFGAIPCIVFGNPDFITAPTFGFDATVAYVGNTIAINGGSAVPMNQFPNGFTGIGNNGTWSNRENLGGGIIIEGESASLLPSNYFVAQTSQFNGSPFTVQVNGNGGSQDLGLGAPLATINNPVDLFAALTIHITSNGKWRGYIAQNIKLTGLCTIVSNSWVLTNLTHPGLQPTFLAGDQGKLTSGNNDLATVTSINIQGATVLPPFDSQSPSQITFTIPPTTPPGSGPASITNPTIFSGQASIGVLNIVVANPSGVYNLTPNKLTDTIYVSSSTGNATVDVARPNPFFKTGYLGG